jgi:hypothetical protein
VRSPALSKTIKGLLVSSTEFSDPASKKNYGFAFFFNGMEVCFIICFAGMREIGFSLVFAQGNVRVQVEKSSGPAVQIFKRCFEILDTDFTLLNSFDAET